LQILLSQQKKWKDIDIEIKTINLDISDEELMKLSKDMCLALNLEEMKKIKNYFSKPEVLVERQKIRLNEITEAELEMLAQTWSEHCKHKIFNANIRYSESILYLPEDAQVRHTISCPVEGSQLKCSEILWRVILQLYLHINTSSQVEFH